MLIFFHSGVGKGRGEYHGYSEVLVKSKCVNEPETNTAQNQETTEENQEITQENQETTEENQEKNEEKKIPTISTVEAMKSLNQLKDYFIFSGELSKSISHSFRELENLLLKIREEEKKNNLNPESFKKYFSRRGQELIELADFILVK